MLLIWVQIRLGLFLGRRFYPEFRVAFRFVDKDFCDESMRNFVEFVAVVQELNRGVEYSVSAC